MIHLVVSRCLPNTVILARSSPARGHNTRRKSRQVLARQDLDSRSLTKRAITPTRSTYIIGRWQKRSSTTQTSWPGIAIVRDDYADYHHVSPVRPVTYGRRRRGRCRGRYVLLPPPRPRTKRRGRHHQEDTGYASAPMSLRSMMGLVPTPRPNGMVGTTKR